MNRYYLSLSQSMRSLYDFLTQWADYTHSEAVQEIERRRG
jgi:hypothetical protein